MYIDYHKWRAFKECPKKFFLEYIEKKPPLVPRNDYFTLYGNLVGKFFEMFCNKWRFESAFMWPEVIKKRLRAIYNNLIESGNIIWSDPKVTQTQEELFEQAYRDVCAVMESHNQNYFLNSRSEVNIEVKFKDGNVINGRIDFIHNPPLSDEIILIDGKGTSKIDSVDEHQLLFYALLCFFQYKKIPIEMGFFYYRYNLYKPVPINEDILNNFKVLLSLDIKKMTNLNNNQATPSAKSCRYCPYFPDCIEGLQDRARRAKKSRLKINEESEGVIEFGF